MIIWVKSGLQSFILEIFSLDEAERLGRPVQVDRDQIKTLTENNQCYTRQEIADILKTSKSIKLLVKIKNVSFILWEKNTDFLANQILIIPHVISHVSSHDHLAKQALVLTFHT